MWLRAEFLDLKSHVIWVTVFKNGPVKLMEDSLKKIWSDFVCLGRPYHFKFYKGCILLILLGPFVNTLTHLIYQSALPLILLISHSINKKITASNIKRLLQTMRTQTLFLCTTVLYYNRRLVQTNIQSKEVLYKILI